MWNMRMLPGSWLWAILGSNPTAVLKRKALSVEMFFQSRTRELDETTLLQVGWRLIERGGSTVD